MSYRKRNMINRAILRSPGPEPGGMDLMTGSQIAKMTLGVVAIIAFAIMVGWFIGQL